MKFTNIISSLLFIFTFTFTLVSSNQTPLSQYKFSPFDSPEFCSQIITPSCNTTFSYIDELNKNLRPSISELVKTSYFKYFKIDLDKQCKFWNAQHFCATENCAVEILPSNQFNWSVIHNENLKPSKLGKIILPDVTAIDNAIETESIDTCEDLDYSHFDEDHACVYVNLLKSPERFTGYGGAQSFDVWKAIYSENCFPNTNPMSMSHIDSEPEQCIEKNLFYRIVSGMHASIAVHLSNEYLDAETGEFYPNLKVFMERVGSFNERLSNIYFNYAIISQSIVKLAEILPLNQFIQSGYDDISPTQKEHFLHSKETESENKDIYNDLLLEDIIPALNQHQLFDTSTLFSEDPLLKDEFRARFKNISAIMDCVGCDRCRMWGKIQIIGYGTAMKILFEDDQALNLKFRRIELVALLNTFDRLSKSIESINKFKSMYLNHLNDVKLGKAKLGDYEQIHKKVQGLGFPFFSTPDLNEEEEEKASDPIISKSSTTTTTTTKKSKSILDPVEKEKLLNRKQRTFTDEFKIAFNDVYQAFKFVINSYITFPATITKISLIQLSHWWDELIGTPKVFTDFESPISIENDKKVKEQEQYNKLFE
ncbi:putative endoplasmic oxidoreductin 1 precursor [Scheffersomyces coipomensis]|uniref:putative endoplasmic oxidoreductin 1 precursor n=1 Tax=Scheffersomyces coipomensis TaxID=1788519 RepID=UPI00315C841F